MNKESLQSWSLPNRACGETDKQIGNSDTQGVHLTSSRVRESVQDETILRCNG